MADADLSKAQIQILDAIRTVTMSTAGSASLTAIAGVVGKTRATVLHHCRNLEALGLLARASAPRREYVLTEASGYLTPHSVTLQDDVGRVFDVGVSAVSPGSALRSAEDRVGRNGGPAPARIVRVSIQRGQVA